MPDNDFQTRWVPLNINVKVELHRKLKVAAAEANTTIRGYVRRAIVEKIKREEQQKEGGNNAL